MLEDNGKGLESTGQSHNIWIRNSSQDLKTWQEGQHGPCNVVQGGHETVGIAPHWPINGARSWAGHDCAGSDPETVYCVEHGNTHLEVHIHDKTHPKPLKHVKQQLIEVDGWFNWGAGAKNQTYQRSGPTNPVTHFFLPCKQGGSPLACPSLRGLKLTKTQRKASENKHKVTESCDSCTIVLTEALNVRLGTIIQCSDHACIPGVIFRFMVYENTQNPAHGMINPSAA